MTVIKLIMVAIRVFGNLLLLIGSASEFGILHHTTTTILLLNCRHLYPLLTFEFHFVFDLEAGLALCFGRFLYIYQAADSFAFVFPLLIKHPHITRRQIAISPIYRHRFLGIKLAETVARRHLPTPRPTLHPLLLLPPDILYWL